MLRIGARGLCHLAKRRALARGGASQEFARVSPCKTWDNTDSVTGKLVFTRLHKAAGHPFRTLTSFRYVVKDKSIQRSKMVDHCVPSKFEDQIDRTQCVSGHHQAVSLLHVTGVLMDAVPSEECRTPGLSQCTGLNPSYLVDRRLACVESSVATQIVRPVLGS